MPNNEGDQFLDVHVRGKHTPLFVVIYIFILLIALTAGITARYVKSVAEGAASAANNTVIYLNNSGNLKEELTFGSWPELENADFFKEIRSKFIAEKADFIETDLSAMQLKLYKAGELVKEAKILSKGRDGSWWETPAGLYKSDLSNFNIFGADPAFRGGKIGFTNAARETMLAIFELDTAGEKRPIAVVVLGSSDAGGDVRKILDWVRNNY